MIIIMIMTIVIIIVVIRGARGRRPDGRDRARCLGVRYLPRRLCYY